MKKLFFLTVAGLLFLSCKKETIQNQNKVSEKTPYIKVANQQSVLAAGASQVSGVGFYATANECDASGQGAAYAVKMTGDLEGCLYVYVDEFDCSPSGTYRETGKEYFVGTYNGVAGTFWTNYKFESRFEGCAPDGSYLGSEIFGRCQHPIVAGSGNGVFEGVAGRMDFKDDIEAGNFPYRGHLQF
jgi:hypothetical protein